jgi:hypothetical protein
MQRPIHHLMRIWMPQIALMIRALWEYGFIILVLFLPITTAGVMSQYGLTLDLITVQMVGASTTDGVDVLYLSGGIESV